MKRKDRWLTAACIAALSLAACEPGARADDGEPWVPTIVARYPHDPNAFTQGLIFLDGYLYESTGRRGESSLRRVDPGTGRIEQFLALEPQYFGEGLAEFDGRLIQLTWESGVGFVYDLTDFSLEERFRYTGQGWGLTQDGERLIMSDGTATLRFLDPDDFSVIGTLPVSEDGLPVLDLNELEYIDGEIWANVWMEDYVVRIDPDTGAVIGRIDLSGLYPAQARPRDAVVNGIAYDEETDRIFVTGKLWPAIFEVEFAERR
ncbi:MAG TPA: glutaminyl-peptide cyclotransferase [Gammaproteobacteria bacterium]|nr:glutaminyl-peptide cyclotransferase [Gammaproteobacteria bacterium]